MRSLAAIALFLVVITGVGCTPGPRTQFVHWVARDAWDVSCAHAAIIEKWEDSNRRWNDDKTRYLVDVNATFKLVNPCEGGTSGRSYKQFETVDFRVSQLEMEKCTGSDGAEGWSLVGGRCLTGPNPPVNP